MGKVMKTNYNLEMKRIIEALGGERKKLLLHSCCGPCSTSVIDSLRNYFDLTVYFYNPNIYPETEYLRREVEQKSYLESIGIEYIPGEYNNYDYESAICGLEMEPEGGSRCMKCFELRLEETGDLADRLNFDYFTTTLTVSTHKNSQLINEVGQKAAMIHKADYLVSDFKKDDGYRKSIQMSKDAGMYRQDYCGCRYSKKEREIKIEKNV